MTTLPLPHGLIAVLEESETDRPAPSKAAVAGHDWTICGCAVCVEWRRKAAALDPSTTAVS